MKKLQYICSKRVFINIKLVLVMDRMLEILKEQEARLVKEQQRHLHEGKIKLSPKINIEEKLRNGYITADDYEKTHQ